MLTFFSLISDGLGGVPKVALNEASRKFGHKTIRKFASETFSTIDFIELESRENPETVTSRASRIFFIGESLYNLRSPEKIL